MALGAMGCLITDKPEFQEPRQTPPFLTNLEPPPAGAQTIPFEPGAGQTYDRTKTINFDIVSEDLGQELTAYVVIDFKGLSSPKLPQKICGFDHIAPSTLASTLKTPSSRPRFTCTLDLNQLVPSIGVGCKTIAVVVSHDFSETFSLVPAKQGDVAVATWLYQVGANPSDPTTYKTCEPDPEPPDAGADVRADRGGF